MKYKPIIWTLVALILISNAFALGIAPAKKNIEFTPDDLTKTYTYTIINNENKELDVNIIAIGELADFIELPSEKIYLTSEESEKTFEIKIILPPNLEPGERTGKIRINKRPIKSYSFLRQLSLKEPLKIAETIIKEQINNFDISVNVKGGGNESQIEASRLAIARALVAITKSTELRRAYLNYDRSLLVADVRRKETYKPGDSKARAKRQKSYR